MTTAGGSTPRPKIGSWTGWTPSGPVPEWINGTAPGTALPWITIYCDDETGGAPPGTHKGETGRYIVRAFERDLAENWHSLTPLDRSRRRGDKTDPGRMIYASKDRTSWGYDPSHTGEDAPDWKFREIICKPCRSLELSQGVWHDKLKPILDEFATHGVTEVPLAALVAMLRRRRG